MMDMTLSVLIWVLVWIVIAFFLMGYDKWQARRYGPRVPEKVLFAVAILGGSIGSIAGMQAFRHKTRHWSFKIGMPVILIAQVTLLIVVSQGHMLPL